MLIPLLCPPGGLLPNGMSLAHSVVVCGGAPRWSLEGRVPKAARTGDETPFGVLEGGDVEACS
jgi:hypothetical protein